MGIITAIVLIYMVIGLLFACETWSHVLDEIAAADKIDRESFKRSKIPFAVFCWVIYTILWPLLMFLVVTKWLQKRSKKNDLKADDNESDT